MKAVFLSDPEDLDYPTLSKLLAHIKKTGEDLVRLHIRTKNKLYKCVSPPRTSHVMTLKPIFIKDVVRVDYLKNILDKKIPIDEIL